MSKPKNRAKKKYNPNRKSAASVQLLQQQAQDRRKYAEDVKHVYEMEMEFTSNGVDKYVKAQRALEADYIAKFPNRSCDPYDILIGAYDFQDLSIALVLEHIKTPEKWIVSADGHFVDLDNPESPLITFEYRQELPDISHQALWHGSKDCVVGLGNGLNRKAWKGLQAEMIAEFQVQAEKRQMPESYSLEEIQVHIAVDAKFKSTTTYQEFLEIQKWLEQGVAKEKLRALWHTEMMIMHVKNATKNGLTTRKLVKAGESA